MVDAGHERALTLMRRTSPVVYSVGTPHRQLAPHYVDIVALYDRVRGLFTAVEHLLQRELSNEAILLCRPMLTDSLALAELAAADERRRAQLVLGWELHTLAQLRWVMLEGAGRGDVVTREVAAVDGRRAEVEEYARRQGFEPPRHWLPDDHAKALAEKHGRGDEHLDLRFMLQFVHGSTFATRQRYTKVADDTIEIGGPAVERNPWTQASSMSAAQSALYATRYHCTIFELEEPGELQGLLDEVEAMGEEISAARAERPPTEA